MVILTWNCQGIKEGSLKTLMESRRGLKPDVLCLQEAGGLVNVDEAPIDKPVLVENVWEGYSMSYLRWNRAGDDDGGNNRCSMATVFKSDAFKAGGCIAAEDASAKRPIMCVTDKDNTMKVYNIHAGGKKYIEEALKIVSRESSVWKYWVIAGDFNQEPGVIHDWFGEVKQAPNIIFDEKNNTRGVKKIDYAISNAKGKAEVLPQKSDHNQVKITLDV